MTVKKNFYQKPTARVVAVKQRLLQLGSPVPPKKAKAESLDDYDVQDLQTW